MTRPAKKAKEITEEEFLDIAVKYLRGRGWNVSVIGPIKVQQPVHGRSFHFELAVEFLGGKKLDAAIRKGESKK